ncbi:MAG: TetR/AcrR family transcriptional regulator [Gammaproteobacteria bacterium]
MTKPPSTSEKILDAAESLFADSGYDGVSIRSITKLAEVELALVNYHFGSKEALFCRVVERRAAEINAARLQLLERQSMDSSVESIIDAFNRPFLEKSQLGGGWKSYARLIAQIANSPRWTELVMSAQFDPIAQSFIEHMQTVLPNSKVDNIFWGFHFLLGAVTFTFAETGRVDKLSGGKCRSTDLEVICEKMTPFLAAGFRAICGE